MTLRTTRIGTRINTSCHLPVADPTEEKYVELGNKASAVSENAFMGWTSQKAVNRVKLTCNHQETLLLLIYAPIDFFIF
jgi:hypothetical protein